MITTMKKRLFLLLLVAYLLPLPSSIFPLTSMQAQQVVKPEGVVLDTLKVQYVDLEGVRHEGEIICNHLITQDLREIFAELYKAKYPIERIRPISEYGNDDERSMSNNNTSCFCYRVVSGTTKLSKHATGMAIDVNPRYNPYVHTVNGKLKIEPANGKPYADRSKQYKYKITKGDLCYRLFKQHGFRWGGEWRTVKDYQHFEK